RITKRPFLTRIFRVLYTVQFSRFFVVDIRSARSGFVTLMRRPALSRFLPVLSAFPRLLFVSAATFHIISRCFAFVNDFFHLFSIFSSAFSISDETQKEGFEPSHRY
ncbi:hypothetical protein AALB64_11350, partial [Lachnospiraceae bacterium 45-P1]